MMGLGKYLDGGQQSDCIMVINYIYYLYKAYVSDSPLAQIKLNLKMNFSYTIQYRLQFILIESINFGKKPNLNCKDTVYNYSICEPYLELMSL